MLFPCSSVGPFHGMLSFRQGHSSCQKTAPAAAFHELQPPPALPACPSMASPRLQCGCITPWSFMGCSGTAFPTMVFSMGLEHVLPPLLADLGNCAVFSCIFSLLSATAAAHWFSTFFNHSAPASTAESLALGSGGAVLELQQLCSNGGSFCSLLTGTTLAAPCCQNHAL